MEDGHHSPPAKRPKLTGRAFYESIGSPKMILAPMVAQSEFAWRVLTRSYLNPEDAKSFLAYSPMLHARLFTERENFRSQHFQPTKSLLEKGSPHDGLPAAFEKYLDGRSDVDRPLTVQFCANNPEELLEAASYVQSHCDAVDLNLGCPQNIAKQGHYGAFLQEDWDLVYKLVHKLHTQLDVPVTVKIRILETKEKTLEYAKILLSAGASILTVHGRQRHQKGHKSGLADWSVIRYLRDNLPSDTVLFANGNILRRQDIFKCLEVTGADAVMSAEGNLYDPTIFATPPPRDSGNREYWWGRDGKGGYRMDAVFRRYMSILYEYVLEEPAPKRRPLMTASDLPEEESAELDQPPKKRRKREMDKKLQTVSLSSMQAHLFHLLRALVSVHTNVRDALAKSRSGDMEAYEKVLALTERAVHQGLRDYEINPEKYEEVNVDGSAEEGEDDIIDQESSAKAVRACKRPWWVCQPLVRPLPREAVELGRLSLSKKEKKLLQEAKTTEQQVNSRSDNSVYGQRDEDVLAEERTKVPAQAVFG